MPHHSLNFEIVQAFEASDELHQACQRLILQLTRNNPLPTRQELAQLIDSQSSILFMARSTEIGAEVIGVATLVLYRVPTGLRAYIEDVVVDEQARRQGIGEALMRACLERAEQAGAAQVMLTSNPCRVAANQLYQRMGFVQRKTNVYQYHFKREEGK